MKVRGFFPLEDKLALRDDHVSDGAARVACRTAMRATSFEHAAEDYEEAVGGPFPRSSIWRVTHKAGASLKRHKEAEAEGAVAVPERGESPQQRRVAEEQPLTGPANISTDGTMILIRKEGWKEIKMSAISAVSVRQAMAAAAAQGEKARRAEESRVVLSQHSYVAGLREADDFLKYQYAEGLRRGLDRVQNLSSVNDAAAWILRITATNFPQAVQIVDWSHASERLHTVANEVLGEGSTDAATWVEARKDELWHGQVDAVIQALQGLGGADKRWPAVVTQAPGYFEANRERMRYPVFRQAGYPIGSGTVESGGNNVVKLRMRRPGRGWARAYTNGMLALLCEYHSGRFDRTWASLSRPAA